MKRYESDVYEDPADYTAERLAWHDGFSAGVTWGFIAGLSAMGILWWVT